MAAVANDRGVNERAVNVGKRAWFISSGFQENVCSKQLNHATSCFNPSFNEIISSCQLKYHYYFSPLVTMPRNRPSGTSQHRRSDYQDDWHLGVFFTATMRQTDQLRGAARWMAHTT